jgi:hypothetical protein
MKSLLTIVLFAALLTITSLPSPLSAEEDQRISGAPKVTKEQIKELIGKPDFFLLDVRPSEQWRATQVKLPGAVHEDPEDVKDWAAKYEKSAKIVTY